jgi:hypothetical protein
MSLLLEGRAEEARAMLEPLVRRSTAPPRVRANLAVARAAAGDAAGARALLGDQADGLDLGAIGASLGGHGGVAGPDGAASLTPIAARR